MTEPSAICTTHISEPHIAQHSTVKNAWNAANYILYTKIHTLTWRSPACDIARSFKLNCFNQQKKPFMYELFQDEIKSEGARSLVLDHVVNGPARP